MEIKIKTPALDTWRKIRRELKKRNLSPDDIPDDLATEYFKLFQAAQAEQIEIIRERRKKRKEKREKEKQERNKQRRVNENVDG